MKCVLVFFAASILYNSEAQSFTASPDQSIIYDAIQFYYASNGVTYYFRHTDRPRGGVLNLEIIDLFNQQRVGQLSDFAPDSLTINEQILWFLLRYNSREMPLTTGDWMNDKGSKAVTIYDTNAVRKKANSILAALKAKYPGNDFNESSDTLLSPTLNQGSGFFVWEETAAAKFFQMYTNEEALLKNLTTGEGGGFAQNLGEGLADFLIERANEELRAAVFRRLIKAFETHPELPILFPNIYEFLQNVEQYNFDLAIKTIQARAEKDLDNLLSAVPKLSRLSKYKTLINEHPTAVYVLAAMTTLDGMTHKLIPAGIVDSVYLSPYTELKNDHSNAIKFAGYIAQSLQNKLSIGVPRDADKNWILINNIWYGVGGTTAIAEIYFKMLILKDPGIGFNWSISGHDTVAGIKPLAKLRGAFTGAELKSNHLLQMVVSLNKIIDNRNLLLDKKENGDFAFPGTTPQVVLPNRELLFALLGDIFAVADEGLAIIPDSTFPDKARLIALLHQAQNALPLFNRVFDIADQVKLKNYNEVIFNVGLLLKDLLDQQGQCIPEAYFQYGNFLASVAIAKSGADVKAAIDAVALPSGSSSIKKDLEFNVALNGYIGYFARSIDDNDQLYAGFTETHGITAPVGVTISHGLGKGGSLSAFLGIIDVGAIVKYKVSDDPNEAPKPVIEWGNILSPGVHFVYGAPFYLPVSIGVGQQWLPRKVDDNKLKFNGGWNVFIAFDIPMINLASSKRRSTYAINGKAGGGTKRSKKS